MKYQKVVVREEVNGVIKRKGIFEEVCYRIDYFLVSGAMDFIIS